MWEAIGKNYQFYAYTVVQLLIEPGQFFTELPRKNGARRAVGFICSSALFYAVASLLTGGDGRQAAWKMGVIFFVNALGTMALGAVIGHISLVLVAGRTGSFKDVFGIYAFASGITLFLSWLPFLLWITEPWRWWLVYMGFKNSCGLTWKKALCVVVFSLVVQVALITAALMAFGR